MKIAVAFSIAAGLVFAQGNAPLGQGKLPQQQIPTLEQRRIEILLRGYSEEIARLKKEAEAKEAQQPQFLLEPIERWWRNPDNRRMFGVDSEQQAKFNEIFQQFRPKLDALNTALEREEAALEQLVGANSFDETKPAVQIDRIAQARAELEKCHGRMLVAMRNVLTAEQWIKMNSQRKPSR
jgi:Spy/CpxP family protein refolding chaperone